MGPGPAKGVACGDGVGCGDAFGCDEGAVTGGDGTVAGRTLDGAGPGILGGGVGSDFGDALGVAGLSGVVVGAAGR